MYLCPSVPLNQTHVFYGLSVRCWGFPDCLVGKESACNIGDEGDTSSVLELGRSPGGGNSNPLQYSYLENPMDRGPWWATVQRLTKS